MICFVEFKGASGKKVYISPAHVTCVITGEEGDNGPHTDIYLDDGGEIPVSVEGFPDDVVYRLAIVNKTEKETK